MKAVPFIGRETELFDISSTYERLVNEDPEFKKDLETKYDVTHYFKNNKIEKTFNLFMTSIDRILYSNLNKIKI